MSVFAKTSELLQYHLGKLLFILLLLFYFGKNLPGTPKAPVKGSSATPPSVVDCVMTHV